jgi:uncharacterized membrane protein
MRLSALASVIGLVGAIGFGVVYTNQATAVAIDGFVLPTLAPGADVFEIEGPLSAFNVAARTVKVNDTLVVLPAGMLIDTDGDGVGDITLEQLTDPALPTPVGGSMIITGIPANVGGQARFTADSAYFEFAENVVVGPLVAVNAAAGTFQVAGTLVKMNQDPRLPARIFDLGGNEISLAQMAGFEGTLVGAEGHMIGTQMHAKIVETEVIVATPNADTVAIERALYNASKRSVEVRGFVTRNQATGQFAPQVTIDLSCDGLGLVTANVVVDVALNQGEFKYKSNNNAVPTHPGTVCVKTATSPTAQRNVD